MIKLGNVIFCKDGTRLVVIEMPNKEWGVLNLDTYQTICRHDSNVCK